MEAKAIPKIKSLKEKNDYLPTLYVDEPRCDGRMACMRVCPTYAIRVKKGKASIINDLCIDCGECIKACPNKAITPFTSTFGEVKSIESVIALTSPALYAQFRKDINPIKILEGLKKIGFSNVHDISKYCVIASKAIERFIRESKGQKPLISSHCPVIVSLIEIQFPSLIEHLLPIREPRELAAMEIKALTKNENAAIFYITPCSAKLLDIKNPRWKEKSFIDGAIPIRDLYNPLLSAILESKDVCHEDPGIYFEGLEWAVEGGIVNHLPPSVLTLSASGIANSKKILSDIESNKLSEIDFVEIYACEGGCIGGSLTVENIYLARNKIKSLSRNKSGHTDIDLDLQKFELERRWSGRRTKSSANLDLQTAIEKMKKKEKIYARLPKFDCGLCGCPTCTIFAEDIVKGEASLKECIFEELNEMKDDLNTIFQRWKQL